LRIRRLSWIPPFAVGTAAAVAGEVAVGLLLYVTPGFVRPMTLILAVLLSSFALGLWTAPRANDATLPERLRRRWVLVLFAYGAGAVLSAAWTARGGLADTTYTRGLGLAFLAALPLYSCGALLGGMSAARIQAARSPVGAAAAAGAALGTVLAGYVLVATLLPLSIFAFCLVLLSASAIIHGGVVGADGERTLYAMEPTLYGPVSVEDWSWGKSRRERVLQENGRVRGVEDGDGRPLRRWERAVLELIAGILPPPRTVAPPADPRTVLQDPAPPVSLDPMTTPFASGGAEAWPHLPTYESVARALDGAPGEPLEIPLDPAILLLGSGAMTIPRHVLAGQPEVRIDVIERNEVVLDASRSHFYAPAEGDRLQLIRKDPVYGLAQRAGPYQAIVVEAAAVAPQDPVPFAGGATLEALRDRLSQKGMLLIGGVDREHALGLPLERLLAEARKLFTTIAVLAPDPTVPVPIGTRASASEMLLVFSVDPSATLPERVAELQIESVTRAEATGPTAPVDLPGPDSFARPTDGGTIP
jgi:hypothetical protein